MTFHFTAWLNDVLIKYILIFGHMQKLLFWNRDVQYMAYLDIGWRILLSWQRFINDLHYISSDNAHCFPRWTLSNSHSIYRGRVKPLSHIQCLLVNYRCRATCKRSCEQDLFKKPGKFVLAIISFLWRWHDYSELFTKRRCFLISFSM